MAEGRGQNKKCLWEFRLDQFLSKKFENGGYISRAHVKCESFFHFHFTFLDFTQSRFEPGTDTQSTETLKSFGQIVEMSIEINRHIVQFVAVSISSGGHVHWLPISCDLTPSNFGL